MSVKDIKDLNTEIEILSSRFRLLQDRFVAVAMDYKHYISPGLTEDEIFKLRNNILDKLYSARFHFQILADYHSGVELRFKQLHDQNYNEFRNRGLIFDNLYEKSILEMYSLFDSMIFHLCSIFDYIFRLINFINGKTIASNPKWNLFKSEKNIKTNIFCSKRMIDKLESIDQNFVYPLITHRSLLIHTKVDNGNLALTFDFYGKSFTAQFFATKLFKENFPEFALSNADQEVTIKYAALWLIDKSIKSITQILFDLKDEIILTKKVEHGQIVLLGNNNQILPLSGSLWGDQNNN